jgi:hypothetical protein
LFHSGGCSCIIVSDKETKDTQQSECFKVDIESLCRFMRNPDPLIEPEPVNISGAAMNPEPWKNPDPFKNPEPLKGDDIDLCCIDSSDFVLQIGQMCN